MGTILDKARPILIGYPHNKILRIAFFFVHIFLWTRRGGGIYATIFAEDRVRRVRFPYAKEKRMKKKIYQNNENNFVMKWKERENNDQGGITSYRPRGSEGKSFAASFDFISIIDTIVFLWRSFFLFIYLFYFSLFILFFARFSLILNFRKKKKNFSNPCLIT